MTLGLAFWIVFIICVILDWGWNRPWATGAATFGGSFLLYLLLFLLGWHSFGFILQGR